MNVEFVSVVSASVEEQKTADTMVGRSLFLVKLCKHCTQTGGAVGDNR
jgi:hypothetical protein